jgi:hypothetical protein
MQATAVLFRGAAAKQRFLRKHRYLDRGAA